MKPAAKTVTFLACLFFLSQPAFLVADTNKPVSKKEKISYIIGTNMARSLSQIKDEIEIQPLLQGISDQYSGKPLQVQKEEAGQLMRAFSTKMTERQKAKRKEDAQNAALNGKKFLAENQKKKGVMTTKSGLQYKVLREGKGPKPARSDKVKVHYRGTTIDGTEFDSSIKRGKPAVFPVTGVIKGWTEALLLMNVGSKYQLFIPSELAYGERGAGPRIGPNQVLIFDVDLISIVK